jgi:hypothetical protein
VKFQLFELDEYSGEKAKIFSPQIETDTITLYEKFISENEVEFEDELVNLDQRLKVVGNDTGLFEESFDTKAGKFGENLCTFKDKPRRKLRLFFIEFGLATIILGGGGHKPPTAKATQDVEKLHTENRLLGLISITLQRAAGHGYFTVDENGMIHSTTNFIYDTESIDGAPKEVKSDNSETKK